MAWLWKIPWLRRQRLRFRRPLQIFASPIFANYIKFVIKTSTVVADLGDPIYVPQGAGREELEINRKRVETAQNETTAKAYALAGADPAQATPKGARLRYTSQMKSAVLAPCM